MKRFLAVLAVVAIAGVVYVAAAPGGRVTSPTPKQFNALKKQVSTLGKKVTSLHTELKALSKDEGNVKLLAAAVAGALVDCIAKEVPINQFGDAVNKMYGYAYTDSSDTPGFSTALDLTTSSDPKAMWIPTGDSTCVAEVNGTAKNSLKRLATLAHDG